MMNLQNVQEIRDRARKNLENGAVTPNYEGDVQTTVQLLNEVLATEIVCTLRYKFSYIMADGLQSPGVKEEFLEHAREEEEHADQVAERIQELGGSPDYNPATLLQRSHAEYIEGKTLVEMIKGNLVSERIAIESYRDLIRYFADRDPTTRRLLESILAKEEEHASELSSLIHHYSIHAVKEHEKGEAVG
ncbi:MAG: bacterioferritin [Bdellovibrionales bacterium RIFOXYC1_FULL_54_43]|nr:MAG: bacterioferritin [Bdellovibrionales bacterium RIFOXYC1_FULL_54_43]OFZ81970.1 MAG: bacterioferritin [Bdellovibrionales bacterium RIFOXYD1_FULL_55_31]